MWRFGNLVVASQNIPKFAFILWLAINKRLNTQDKVVVWNKVDMLKCSLCHSVMDNHDHLFLVVFSSKVWCHFKSLMRFEDAPDNLLPVIDLIASRTIGKSIWSIIQRLVLSAVVYHVWIERNNRIFQNKSRNINDLCDIIREAIRLRLLSLNIKGSKNSLDASKIWDFQLLVVHKCSLRNVVYSRDYATFSLIGGGFRDLFMLLYSSYSFDVVFSPFSAGFCSWTVHSSPVLCKPSLDDTWSSLIVESSWCVGYPTWYVPSTDDVWIIWLYYDSLVSGSVWSDLGYLMFCSLLAFLCLKGWFGFFVWSYLHVSLGCLCYWDVFRGNGCCFMARRTGICMLDLVLFVRDRKEWFTGYFVIVGYMGCLEGYFVLWNALSAHFIGLNVYMGSYFM
ncbi:RNA-directed DNA polymerase, eukaryota, Reverse transcriptase zinc-binding domain protein [Artemisia annua]|uniref:RNA-directed DNA polymerase, eukaryota, Reverse transcriptase zinc-binding domain protein n=1 Tax=Artemisia annua TaxID=35608 RepID=A0A2U1L0N3_ARTAN|nr:RNA-directed DNA polymerase, eukaryota, Reverse transcriptase zinc-binding domain protein [Artemisia annua]